MCHTGVLIYAKKCLKAVAVNFSEVDYHEYVYCKLLSKNSGLLQILCIYRLQHMKNKGVRQWHILSRNLEAIDV